MLIKKHLEKDIDLLLKVNTLQKTSMNSWGFFCWDICCLYNPKQLDFAFWLATGGLHY